MICWTSASETQSENPLISTLCAQALIGVLVALRVMRHRSVLCHHSSLRDIWFAVTDYRQVGATSVGSGRLDEVRHRSVRERTAAQWEPTSGPPRTGGALGSAGGSTTAGGTAPGAAPRPGAASIDGRGAAGISGMPPVRGLMWTFQCSAPFKLMSSAGALVEPAEERCPTPLPSGRSFHTPLEGRRSGSGLQSRSAPSTSRAFADPLAYGLP